MQHAAKDVRTAVLIKKMTGGGASSPQRTTSGRAAGGGGWGRLSDDDGGGGVAIFPSSSDGPHPPPPPAFQPPAPTHEDPTPRRRSSAHAGAMAGVSAASARALKDLGGAMQGVAAISHETTVQGLLRQTEAVATVLLGADACRLCIVAEEGARTLSWARNPPGGEGCLQTEVPFSGVTGIIASSGSTVVTADLASHPVFDAASDLAHPPSERNALACLAGPARDKGGEIRGVLSVFKHSKRDTPAKGFGGGEDEETFRLVCAQVGVALDHIRSLRVLSRQKAQAKLLVKAAIDLSRGNTARGPLSIAAAVFAKKLVDADAATVFEVHGRRQYVRFWELLPGRKGEGGAKSGSKLVERDHTPLPRNLKRVLAGVMVNQLVRGGADVVGGGSDGGITSVYDGDVATFDDKCDNIMAAPLKTDPGAPIVGMVLVRNKNGGPSKLGRLGLFTKEDEEALRELASVVASVFSRAEAVTEQASTLTMMPTLTAATVAPQAVNLLSTQVSIALKADKTLVFLVTPEGDFGLYEHGEVTQHRFPASSYPFTLVSGAGRGAQRVKLKNLSDTFYTRKSASLSMLATASSVMFCPLRSEAALHGCVFAVISRDAHFHDSHVALLESISAQAAAVLDNCAKFEQHREHGEDLQDASLQMLQVVEKREVDAVIRHVSSRMAEYVGCSRAVLYIADQERSTLWTVFRDDEFVSVSTLAGGDEGEGGGEASVERAMSDADGSALSGEGGGGNGRGGGGIGGGLVDIGGAQPGAQDGEDGGGGGAARRIGFANLVLRTEGPCVVRDFAYGRREFNEVLDSADESRVDTLLKKHKAPAAGAPGGHHHAHPSAQPAALAAEMTESVAALPVRDKGGRVVAVLQFMNRWRSRAVRKPRKEGFDEQDMQKLSLVVAAVACALETCNVMSRRWEAERGLRSLLDASDSGLEVAVGAAARVDLTSALTFAAKYVCERTKATQVAAYLQDPLEAETMEVIRFEGNLFRPAKRVRMDVEGVAGHVISTGELLNLPSARSHERFLPGVDDKPHIPAHCCVVCPIRDATGRVVGALSVQNKVRDRDTLGGGGESTSLIDSVERHKARVRDDDASPWMPFGEGDVRVISGAARGLGVSLGHFELLDRVSGLSERLKDVSRDIDVAKSLRRIGTAAAHLAQAQRGMVYLLDEKTGELCCDAHGIRIPGALGLPGSVVRQGGVVNLRTRKQIEALLESVEQYEGGVQAGLGLQERLQVQRYLESCRDFRSALGIPLYNQRGAVAGVLELSNREGQQPFSSSDERLVATLGSHAYSHVTHAMGYQACAARLGKQTDLMRRVVGLVEHVSSYFGGQVPEQDVYTEVARASKELMGAATARLYVRAEGRQEITVYDSAGNRLHERPSNLSLACMESCALVNNTSKPVEEEGDDGRSSDGRSEADGEGGGRLWDDVEHGGGGGVRGSIKEGEVRSLSSKVGEVRSLSIDFGDYPTGLGGEGAGSLLEEKKLMCVPIERAAPNGNKGKVVTAALELEAPSYAHEWKTEDEDTLRVLARVASTVLDMASHAKAQFAKGTKTSFLGAGFLDRDSRDRGGAASAVKAKKEAEDTPTQPPSSPGDESSQGSPVSPGERPIRLF